jgi:branched-chain amino acid transport system ATP-binding protein
MTRPTLEIRGLCKRFGGIVVADQLALTIGRGEIVGLIGPNGAGKTSLFNLVTGFVPADAGDISIHGERIDGLPAHKRARVGVARTWQNARIFTSLSVCDNLVIGARDYPGESIFNNVFRRQALAQARKHEGDRAERILERIHLVHKADAFASDLSFGQQKLLAIGRALMNNGPCLLLDEPMAGVAGHIYETIGNVIREEASAGTAVCLVEHNVGFVRELCHRGVFMFTGKVMADGPVDELLNDPRLTELYFGVTAGKAGAAAEVPA